jgi:hypothetical protein
MAKKKSGKVGKFAAAAIIAAAAVPVVASEPGAIPHDYCRTLKDASGKKVRRVIEQHNLTRARAAAWQAELREQGFTDAEFVPSKK